MSNKKKKNTRLEIKAVWHLKKTVSLSTLHTHVWSLSMSKAIL